MGNDRRFRLGIDIGGTFTDFLLVDSANKRVQQAKAPSTPRKPAQAIRAGLELLAAENNRNLSDFLAQISLIIHGTTVALNALIELKGAKTGLLATRGFRDVFEMRLGYKEERYDFAYEPPPMLVPRQLRLPITERIDKTGAVVVPLDEAEVRAAIQTFKSEGVEAVAVCFLWSFLNPTHEKRVGDILRQEFPEAYVTLSVDVLPLIREYSRTSTTILNAYLGPLMQRYIAEIEAMFQAIGYTGQVRYLQANGGIASGEVMQQESVMALHSGPATGPTAGLFFGNLCGFNNIITVDMGGTSFDAGLIENGQVSIVKGVDLHRYHVGVPVVDINTVGAGGGSVAWIDGGLLRVGPHSAGADPGPVCYGRGGEDPTVTDADVALGYMNPSSLLSGRVTIDSRASLTAIQTKVADPLALDVDRAAIGIYGLVNRNMANAISEISVQRGYDPRDFVLVVAGGAGPIHAAHLADEMGIPTILIPKYASTFCAFGAVVADLRHDYSRSYVTRLVSGDIDLKRINALYAEMEHNGRVALSREGIVPDSIAVARTMDIRYVDQVWEVTVPVDLGEITNQSLIDIRRKFDERHKELYTFHEPKNIAELVTIGLTVWGRVPKIELPRVHSNGGSSADARQGERSMLLPGQTARVPVPIYDGERLEVGQTIEGPGVIEEVNTTILIPPGWRGALNEHSIYVFSKAPLASNPRLKA